MLTLVALTSPGPFGSRNLSIGDFVGHFSPEGELIAMAGERTRADQWHEVSAICTHPDHQGQALARRLTFEVVRRMLQRGETPFLHAMSPNGGARRMCRQLGFREVLETPIRVIRRLWYRTALATMIPSQFASQVSLRRDAIESLDRFPFDLPALRGMDTVAVHPKVTFFTGENGSGKSTLLEAIAISLGFNPEGGTRNFNFNTRASHSDLHAFIRVAKGFKQPKDGFFLRAESFFNVATQIEELDAEPAPAPRVIDSYEGQSLKNNPLANRSWRCCRTVSAAMAFTSSTNQRPPCPRNGNWPPFLACTTWCTRTPNSSSPSIHPSSWPTRTRGSAPVPPMVCSA